ncbi:MAG: lysophospholipid acyltransferase family protein [Ottowia sp.]|nr:lysophospholipid acyltransferase family protein [Ottowia sp.]
MLALFRWVSRLPLGLLHALGAASGWLTWLLSPTYRRRIRDNSAQAGFAFARIRGCIAHAGRMVLETPRLWFGPPVPVQWGPGLVLLERSFARGKGVVLLTPHLGCFEITAQGVSQHFSARYGPLTVLYRRARQPALARVIEHARKRDGLDTAPATLSGVRQLIRALRKGQAVGLLPDQVPPQGQGVWSPVFGKPAYSMTLAARLVQKTGADPLLIWGERLAHARGFYLHVEPFDGELSPDLETAVGQINGAMEALIRQRPEQYLWGYGRYKTPRSQA